MVCPGCEHTLENLGGYLEDVCLDMAFAHGMMLRYVKCHRCGNPTRLRKVHNTNLVHRCDRRVEGVKCNFLVSARKGTFFARSNLTVPKIMKFSLLWLLLRNPRQRDIMDELGISSSTVVDWSSYCREVCVEWALERRNKIGGPGTVVEIDESVFGPRKYNRGGIVDGQWIFGGVQRGDSTKFFLVPVEQRDNETLIQIINEWIIPGTIIISDCWKTNDTLQHEGFVNLKVSHSVEFVCTNRAGYIHLQNIATMRGHDISVYTSNMERKWRSVRYSVPIFGIKKEHFEGYFAEYLFKKVHARRQMMHHFLMAAAAVYPPNH